MKKYMIITVGTGKGVEYGLAKSIKFNGPDKIIFIATKESLDQEMPQKIGQIMRTHFKRTLPEHRIALVEDPQNVEKVYQVTYEAIRAAQQEGAAREDIYLDFTSGTKAMSVGAALAAYLNKCRTMVYIGGSERDPETGRVLSGTEVVMTFTLRDVFENYRPNAATDDVFQETPREIKR